MVSCGCESPSSDTGHGEDWLNSEGSILAPAALHAGAMECRAVKPHDRAATLSSRLPRGTEIASSLLFHLGGRNHQKLPVLEVDVRSSQGMLPCDIEILRVSQ